MADQNTTGYSVHEMILNRKNNYMLICFVNIWYQQMADAGVHGCALAHEQPSRVAWRAQVHHTYQWQLYSPCAATHAPESGRCGAVCWLCTTSAALC